MSFVWLELACEHASPRDSRAVVEMCLTLRLDLPINFIIAENDITQHSLVSVLYEGSYEFV